MPSKILKVAAVFVLFATGVSAQTITITPRGDGPLPSPPPSIKREVMRVTVTIQSLTPVSPQTGDDEQAKLAEGARRKLYEATAHECILLRDVYKGDCKLSQLSVNSSVQERGTAGLTINTNGNATYELTLRDPQTDTPARP